MSQSKSKMYAINVFGFGGDEAVIAGREGGAPKNENYVFQPLLLKKLIAWLSGGLHPNLMLIGETGAGKSSVVEEVCARLGIPLFSTACSGDTRFESLVGSMSLENGNTFFKDGPLTAAMRVGGVFLANEITRMNAGEQMRLADVLDKGGKLTIPETGEVVYPAEGFRFAATGNSGGFGDETGAYAGERNASLAFRNRFNVIRISPLDQESEEKMLSLECPDIPPPILSKMVEIARELRRQFVGNGGSLPFTVSHRDLVKWGFNMVAYSSMNGIEDAFIESMDDAFLNGVPQDTHKTVHELVRNWLSR